MVRSLKCIERRVNTMVTDQTQKFGDLLRSYRHRTRPRLTQKDLAKKAGYSVTYISMLERGERDPSSPETAETLSEALNLSQEDRAELMASVSVSVDASHLTTRHVDWGEAPDLEQF